MNTWNKKVGKKVKRGSFFLSLFALSISSRSLAIYQNIEGDEQELRQAYYRIKKEENQEMEYIQEKFSFPYATAQKFRENNSASQDNFWSIVGKMFNGIITSFSNN